MFNRCYRCICEYDITLEELLRMQRNGAYIIDVRNNRAYNEGHIEGSINIADYQIQKLINTVVYNKNETIVLYCSSGYRSKDALKKLKKLGYINVFNLYGGLDNY